MKLSRFRGRFTPSYFKSLRRIRRARGSYRSIRHHRLRRR